MNQPTLFERPPKDRPPRRKPRKLAHVVDAGPGFDSLDRVKFGCHRCDWESEWRVMLCSEAKRGVPCPRCNPLPIVTVRQP